MAKKKLEIPSAQVKKDIEASLERIEKARDKAYPEPKLEDMIGKQAVTDLRGKSFGIGVNSKYKRERFVEHSEDLIKGLQYYPELQKNINNYKVFDDSVKLLLKYLPGDKGAHVQNYAQNPRLILEDLNDFCSKASYKMAKFVEKNRGSLLNKLSGEELFSVFEYINLEFFKSKNKKHNSIRELRKRYLPIKYVKEQGKDPTGLGLQYFPEVYNKCSKDVKEFINKNPDRMKRAIAVGIVRNLERRYNELFKDNQGNLKKHQIKKYLIDNYKIAEDFINGIPANAREERKDYWDDHLKPHYLAVSETLHGSEKPVQKWLDNPEKELRKLEARALGMAA